MQRYIRDPDTLVLCVVEATDAALDKGNALKILSQGDKLPSTILALTKSDKVHEEDIEDQIFKRILLTSETSQLEGLKGCVAIVNRRQQDSTLTLQQAADKEAAVFRTVLSEALAEYQSADMQRQLARRLTSKQLIVMLDKMYHDHIVHKWKAGVLAKIKKAKQEAVIGQHALGVPPEKLTSADVLQMLYQKVKLNIGFMAGPRNMADISICITMHTDG